MALYAKMKGPVDYTVVGSPTITDGVASGFSTANYLKLTDNFRPGNNTWEICCKFKTAVDVTTIQDIYSFQAGSTIPTRYRLGLIINKGKFEVNFTLDGTSWFGNTIISTYSVLPNTTYITKECWDGSSFKLYVSTDEGETYQKIFELSSVTPIYNSFTVQYIGLWSSGILAQPFLGSIDFNDTYIKVNGQLWFGNGFDRVKIRTAPYTRCTVYGTPTIIGGIASNFSNTNYLKINQTYNSTNNKNVEIYVRAKTPTTITSIFNPIFGIDSINIFGISSYSNSVFTIRMGYQSGTIYSFEDMYITGNVQPSTWYRFKITGNNGLWRAEVYDDNNTLLKSADRDWSNTPFSQNYDILLRCVDNTKAYSGSIDLNASYIKIDGQYWWRGDMQYAETYTLRLGD